MVVAAARAAAHALGVLPADDGEGDGATEGARANEGGFAHGRIRLAVMSDLSELRRLERELVKVERPMDPLMSLADDTAYYDVEHLITDQKIKMAVMESPTTGRLIATGYVQLKASAVYKQHTHHGALNFMIVDAEHRGQAINKLVLGWLMDQARLAWGRSLQFYIEGVYTDNTSAVRAYRKAGFVPVMMQMVLRDQNDAGKLVQHGDRAGRRPKEPMEHWRGKAQEKAVDVQ